MLGFGVLSTFLVKVFLDDRDLSLIVVWILRWHYGPVGIYEGSQFFLQLVECTYEGDKVTTGNGAGTSYVVAYYLYS
jgi:hypothetical protein